MLQCSRHLSIASVFQSFSRPLWSRIGVRKLSVMSNSQQVASKAAAHETSSAAQSSSHASSSKLVMQIIMPRSLVTEQKWPVGPLLAQSAHAATAVLHLHSGLPEVKGYLANWEIMRKTVMEVENEDALWTICKGLDDMDKKIPYHLWIEQPENTPTALALVPNSRPSALKRILDGAGCKLWQ